jgi:hypothetical protein
MSKIEVDAITEQSGSTLTTGGGAGKTVVVDATTVTLGRCGGTVALASGASQTGFGRTGTVDWQTTVKTGDFTAANGEGYFVNTTGGVITVTLPSSPSAGNIVAIQDYAGNAATNNITVARNSSPINGGTDNLTISENNASAFFVYIDGTQGWKVVGTAALGDLTEQASFIVATGGTVTQSGNFKIHTFTGPGTFTVCSVGNAIGSEKVSYMVVAGGGGGGANCSGGGGGAGGFREGKASCGGCYTASPIVAPDGLPVSAQAYPITVGAGGPTPDPSPFTGPSANGGRGASGSNSIFSTITSAGGGGGGGGSDVNGLDGGSGGGGAHSSGSVGSGNVPPVSPAQGKNGATPNPGSGPAPSDSGGGGGGATACGVGAPSGRQGGAGATTSINGTPTAFSGGGGGTNRCGGSASDTAGGTGGGGRGGFGSRPSPVPESRGINGTDNTGGGGGGGKPQCAASGSSRTYGGAGLGGSGIVIIRYKYQ